MLTYCFLFRQSIAHSWDIRSLLSVKDLSSTPKTVSMTEGGMVTQKLVLLLLNTPIYHYPHILKSISCGGNIWIAGNAKGPLWKLLNGYIYIQPNITSEIVKCLFW